MQQIQSTYKKSLKGITLALLFLFGLHFFSIHGFVDSLVYCFEENGDVNIESKTDLGIFFNSEAEVHENDGHDHQQESVFHQDNEHHRDVPISLVCAKEDKLNRFDQERTLKFLDGILYSKVEHLPQSRVFHLVSYAPPLIEDAITASLSTVVRILYN